MSTNKEHVDRALIRRCLDGEPRAQKELYERYSGKMYALCLRYCDNRDTAKDMLQEGFVRVFRSLANFRHEGSFEGWMKRIMVNQCIEQYRKEQSDPWFSDVQEAHHIGVDDHAFSRLGMQDLMRAVQSLPRGYRTVFNLYAIEGYTHKEIGNQLGISENTSKTQLLKARNMLKRIIAAMEGSSHG
jgi:RNA polymerase sigma-70 factor (ECF subfamily)